MALCTPLSFTIIFVPLTAFMRRRSTSSSTTLELLSFREKKAAQGVTNEREREREREREKGWKKLRKGRRRKIERGSRGRKKKHNERWNSWACNCQQVIPLGVSSWRWNNKRKSGLCVEKAGREREREMGWKSGGDGRVADKVFVVPRTDYKARLLPFFGIQIISLRRSATCIACPHRRYSRHFQINRNYVLYKI